MRSVLLLFFTVVPASAHALQVEATQRGAMLVVVVGYDDDTPAAGAKVQLIAVSGSTLQETTDDTGTVRFPMPVGRVRIVADDGQGPRCEVEFGTEVPAPKERVPPGVRTGGGLAVILALTLLLRRRLRR
jgi:hypothetical protein